MDLRSVSSFCQPWHRKSLSIQNVPSLNQTRTTNIVCQSIDDLSMPLHESLLRMFKTQVPEHSQYHSTVYQYGLSMLVVVPHLVRFPIFHLMPRHTICDNHLWSINGFTICRLTLWMPFSTLSNLFISRRNIFLAKTDTKPSKSI